MRFKLYEKAYMNTWTKIGMSMFRKISLTAEPIGGNSTSNKNTQKKIFGLTPPFEIHLE